MVDIFDPLTSAMESFLSIAFFVYTGDVMPLLQGGPEVMLALS